MAESYIRTDESASTARHKVLVVSDDELLPRPFILMFLTDGVAVLVDETGVAIPYPVFAGGQMAFRAVKLVAGTTATVVGQW